MFIRARTQEQFNERRQEIINATQLLYREYSFREINFSKISEKTKIARSTIYNYYLNKEEIFLDIIEKHFMNIKKGIDENLLSEKLERQELVDRLTKILMDNYELLILISLYIEQIEYTCSQAKLNDFKANIKELNETLYNTARFQFPALTEKEIQFFIQAFYSALHGISPACSPIKKQKIAMEKAGIYVEFGKKEFISFYINTILSCVYDTNKN